MQAYDIVMLVVLVGAAAWGFMKGLAWQLASIASLVVSYFVAMSFRGVLAPALPGEPPLNNILAMLILFVVSSLAVWIGFRFVSETIEKVKLKAFDHQVGALFGFGKGVLYCVIITLFAATLLKDRREAIVTSKSGHYISLLLTKADPLLPEGVQEAIAPYVQELESGRPPAKAAPADSPEAIADKLINSALESTTTTAQDQLSKKFQGFRDRVQNEVQSAFDQSANEVQDQVNNAASKARDQVDQFDQQFDTGAGDEDLDMVEVQPPTRRPSRR